MIDMTPLVDLIYIVQSLIKGHQRGQGHQFNFFNKCKKLDETNIKLRKKMDKNGLLEII